MNSPQAKTGVEVERLISEALAAIKTLPKWGPKRFDWKASKDHTPGELSTDPVLIYVETEDVSPNSVDVLFEGDWGTQEDANFIEACSPANIGTLLASLAAERAEAVRVREENEKLMDILRSWKAAQDYTAQYSHLPAARDEISGAWESAMQARDAALSPSQQGEPK